jgi:hypothetical protein
MPKLEQKAIVKAAIVVAVVVVVIEVLVKKVWSKNLKGKHHLLMKVRLLKYRQPL